MITATIRDVARLALTSPATVSRFLNGEKVKKHNEVNIMKAIQALDYQVHAAARSLKTNKSFAIGYIVPDLTNIFFSHIAKSAQKVLYNAGYSLIVLSTDNDPERESEIARFLIEKQVDGIMVSSVTKKTRHLEEIKSKQIPLVLIDRMLPGLNVDVVLVDNVNGTYNAIELLIKNGHKRIGIINGPQHVFTGMERYKGYLRAFEDYGLELDENLVKYGDFEIVSGYQKMTEFVKQPNPPTAVFVSNYYMSIGAIAALNENNIKIPDELSFVGFDDIELSCVHKPKLTTIMQPMSEIGEVASQILLKRVQGEEQMDSVQIHRLKTNMVSGDSIRFQNS